MWIAVESWMLSSRSTISESWLLIVGSVTRNASRSNRLAALKTMFLSVLLIALRWRRRCILGSLQSVCGVVERFLFLSERLCDDVVGAVDVSRRCDSSFALCGGQSEGVTDDFHWCVYDAFGFGCHDDFLYPRCDPSNIVME